MNRDDILHSLGLQTLSERDSILPAMGIFGAGILVGAGLGMLFAPKPGRELRDDLRRNAEGLGENIKHKAEDLRQRLPDSVGGMIQNVQHAVTGGGEDEPKQLAGSAGQSGSTAKRKADGGEPRTPSQH
jgi:hypothetical protein